MYFLSSPPSSGRQISSPMTGGAVCVAGMSVLGGISNKQQNGPVFANMVARAVTVLGQVPDFVKIPTSALEFN